MRNIADCGRVQSQTQQCLDRRDVTDDDHRPVRMAFDQLGGRHRDPVGHLGERVATRRRRIPTGERGELGRPFLGDLGRAQPLPVPEVQFDEPLGHGYLIGDGPGRLHRARQRRGHHGRDIPNTAQAFTQSLRLALTLGVEG